MLASKQHSDDNIGRSWREAFGEHSDHGAAYPCPETIRQSQVSICNIIATKLEGSDARNDEDAAIRGSSTARTVRRRRACKRRFGSTKPPSNGAGRPKAMTPNMMAVYVASMLVLHDASQGYG